MRIQKGARISVGAYLAPYGGRIEIGDNAFIGPYATLYGHGGLTIGNDVLIAGHVTIIPAQHRFRSIDLPIREQGEDAAGIRISDDVWIGTGARILDGITIGQGVVIAAGAVVTSSLPDYSIAAGVPARVIKSRQSGKVADISVDR